MPARPATPELQDDTTGLDDKGFECRVAYVCVLWYNW